MVRIHLAQSNGELAFAVEDDGRGFDQDSTALGSGLQTMSDRLAALGGQLRSTLVPVPNQSHRRIRSPTRTAQRRRSPRRSRALLPLAT